uniref:Protein AF-9 homolog n=1 Tax=Acrobeloides nanus TaxID=290746 RepID=A0A914D887_9BILA
MSEATPTGVTTVERIRNQKIVKRIIYGNTAIRFDRKREADGHTHEWTLYLRSYDQEDLSKFIRKVQFKLHDSYPNPLRWAEQPPFEISETGWGEFEVQIKIYFVDVNEKPLTAYYYLRLFQPVFQLANGKEMVVAEYYDEIIFQEPTLIMYQVLTDQKDFKKHDPRRFYTDFEQIRLRTIENLNNARDEIGTEITDLRASLRDAYELIQKYSKELDEDSSGVTNGGNEDSNQSRLSTPRKS